MSLLLLLSVLLLVLLVVLLLLLFLLLLQQLSHLPFSMDPMQVAGWGTTVAGGGSSSSVLRKVDVRVWRNKKCKTSYGQNAPGGIQVKHTFYTTQFPIPHAQGTVFQFNY